MAKMTYRDFDVRVRDVFEKAQENLASDGHLAQILFGVDAYGRDAVLVQATNDVATDAERALAARSGITLLPHPLRDQTEALSALFTAHKVVAALHISESWLVMGFDDAQDVISRGVAPSEHESRAEIMIVMGAWPREFYSTIHTALITRDTEGHPTARPSFTHDNDSQHGPILDRMSSWLLDLLPKPYGRG